MDYDPELQITLTKDGCVRMFTIAPSPIFDGHWVVRDGRYRSRPRVVEQDHAVPAREEFDVAIRELLEAGWIPA